MIRTVLHIHRNHMHARDAWARMRDENPDAAASYPVLLVVIEGVRHYHKSASSVDRLYLVGRWLDEVHGLEHVTSAEVRAEIAIRLKPRS